jgi:signal transduction histidine kinase
VSKAVAHSRPSVVRRERVGREAGAHAAGRPAPPLRGRSPERLAELGQALLEVAHQVRGPLGALQLYSRLLDEKGDDPGARRRLVRKILMLTVGLSTTLEDMFFFTEEEVLRRQPCHLLDLLEGALQLAEAYVEERQVAVTRLYAGELDAVAADPRLLTSVFVNVLLNAAQAVPPGGGLTVALGPVAHSGGLQEVRIEDDGPGFSAAALVHLFEPFFTDKAGGLGLGLAVARRIVEAHGGSIEVANRAGGGATVRIELPVR